MFTYLVIILWINAEVGGGSDGKESACNPGDPDSIPGSGRSPGEGNGYPLQYSCLENPMDRGAWRAKVHGVSKSHTWLSDWTTRKVAWSRLSVAQDILRNQLLAFISSHLSHGRDFPGGSDSKASVYNAGDPDSIPGSGRSPGEGNGNPLQYYCLENPMDGGAW